MKISIFLDTPGINDSKGHNQEFVKLIPKKLKNNYTHDINSFLFLFNINTSRLTLELKKITLLLLFNVPNKRVFNSC